MRELIILYTETNTEDEIGGFTTVLTQLREQYADVQVESTGYTQQNPNASRNASIVVTMRDATDYSSEEVTTTGSESIKAISWRGTTYRVESFPTPDLTGMVTFTATSV
jgi:glycine cleavage system protein P-like pyridoxal-binding family